LRKAFSQLFLAISIALIGPIQMLEAQEEPNIRVLLIDDKSLSFRKAGARSISINGIDSLNGIKRAESLKLQLKNGTVRIFVDGSLQHSSKKLSELDLRLSTADSRGIWLANRRYGGELRITSKGDKLRVVNYLGLEKYLTSVVGGEMPKSWPLEALKAQAVAARTYVLNQLKANAEYDVGSTQSNQVYLGLEAETPKTYKAVNATRSLVIVHRGKLIDAVFHSSSGGRTENSASVWGKEIPYLVGAKDFDQSSPAYTWTKRFTSSQLKQAFPEIGGVNTFRVLTKTDTQRVKKVIAYGPKGKSSFSGKELRQRLDLKSTLITFKIVPANSNQKKSSSYLNLNQTDEDKSKLIYPTPPPFFGEKSAPELPSLNKNYILEVKGSGAGHGVGMSQWGANGMAKKGSSYRRIIYHYYKGVKIIPLSLEYL